MVDQDQVSIECNPVRLEFIGLSRTDEIARIRPLETRGEGADHGRARRACQLRKLLQQGRIMLPRSLRLQQQSTLTFF